jgi:hypothetical protein
VFLMVGLLPASTAFAQDDVTCLQDETRQYSEGFHTTVVHYCTRWQWHPPSGGDHDGTTPAGDHDPDGGKGGTPDTPDPRGCDSVKQSLAEAKEELDLVNKQIEVARTSYGDAMTAETAAWQASSQANDKLSRAEDDVDFFFTAYEVANGLDDEIETSPKAGVTIVRPRTTLRPDHSLAYGIELDVAMRQQAAAKAARDAAAAAYTTAADELVIAQSAYNNLVSRQAALAQVIERLRSQLGSCEP